MSEFTMRNVYSHVESNLCSLNGLTFSPRCDVADIIRDALESDNATAPEAIYYADAWNVVAGSDFASVDVDIDFSDCKNALDCVTREANEILDSAYHSCQEEMLTTLACCMEELFSLDNQFPGASRYTVEEVRQVKGCALGYVPHSYEFDLNADGSDAPESVCVWIPQRQLYFKAYGMEFVAELVEIETE